MKNFIMIVLTLGCGILAGYYIGSYSGTKNQDESIISGAETATSSVYNGPFGLSQGLSLNEVKQVCKVKHIESDAYEITPPKANAMFKTYLAWIDPDYGLYAIRAISEEIHANAHGTELKSRFENITESIESKYGKCKRVDKNSDRVFDEPRYFMYTLKNGSRELSAAWAKKEQSQLPDDIVSVYVEVVAKNSYSDSGYVILEYGFSNSDAVKAKADAVF